MRTLDDCSGPSNKRKHARVIPIDETSYKVEWKPIEAGEHLIDVQLFEQSVYESPFVCNVGDPDLVTVRKIPKHIEEKDLHKEHSFEIDATAAGSGNLEIIINDGRVPCRVRELSSRHFQAQFTPAQRITHTIEMKFNGEHVRGSPWTVPIRDSSGTMTAEPPGSPSGERYSELVGVGLKRSAVGEVTTFDINGELSPEDVVVRIVDPDGKPASTDMRIVRIHPGLLRCEYKTRKVGEHRLEAFINGRLIDSGPLLVSAYDPRKIAIQPVAGGVAGSPVQFVGKQRNLFKQVVQREN
ncbi:Filamin repeat-like protein [Aphelenchoides avenae]|nr:Filamin repeat-like protein [Aphelenchus avenae]